MRAELKGIGRVCSSSVATARRLGPLSRAVTVAALGAAMAVGPVATPTAAEPRTVARAAAPRPDDGLRTETNAQYVVDPAAGAIQVSVEMTLTNEVAAVDRGTYVEQAYFSHFSVPVLTEAANFSVVRGDGTGVPVAEESIEGDPWVKYATIDVPDIYYAETETVRLSYQLLNQPPRATGLSRANDAFISFPAFADGDPGMTSIEVRLPEQYEVEVVGGELERTERDGQIVLTATAIADPAVFIPVVVASDDAHLVSRSVDLDGVAVEALAWPDDPQWADFVIEQLGSAIPVLTEMIGQAWPVEDELDVIETAAPYAYGYAGWYEELDNSISIGDDLDPLIIVHEVSHAWFNRRLFSDRWVNEAFAGEYATRTLDELGQPQGVPPTPDRAAPAAVALNEWGDPSLLDQQSEATETYGYQASWFMLDQIAEEIGVERLRAVIDAAADEEIAYAGDLDPEEWPGSTSWQRLLDLLEEVGGSQQAAPLFDTYVVNESQRAELTARAAAREDYAALAERGEGWSPPFELRKQMADWEFAGVDATVTEAGTVLDARHEIEQVLEGTDVERLALEESYETADDVADVVPEAEATLDAAEDYRAAEERFVAGRGLLGGIGLWGSGTGGRLDDARTELEAGDPEASQRASATVERRLDTATRNGLLRLTGLVIVGGATGFGIIPLRRWRRRRAEARRAPAGPRPWSPPPPFPPGSPPPATPAEPSPTRPVMGTPNRQVSSPGPNGRS